MPRLSQVTSSVRSSLSARSTSAAVSPSVRARTASRAAARILALDREQPLGDGGGVWLRGAGQALRREPLGEDRSGGHSRHG